MALGHIVLITLTEDLVYHIENCTHLPWQDSQVPLHCKEPHLGQSVADCQQCNTNTLLWWGDKRKTLPIEIPQESLPGAACAGLGNSPSTLGMSMMDPELRTRRDPGLQLHTQQNATCKRELGARFWKEELELSHY